VSDEEFRDRAGRVLIFAQQVLPPGSPMMFVAVNPADGRSHVQTTHNDIEEGKKLIHLLAEIAHDTANTSDYALPIKAKSELS
jgi:hypothetical protein